jgi:hypothetical protein
MLKKSRRVQPTGGGCTKNSDREEEKFGIEDLFISRRAR